MKNSHLSEVWMSARHLVDGSDITLEMTEHTVSGCDAESEGGILKQQLFCAYSSLTEATDILTP